MPSQRSSTDQFFHSTFQTMRALAFGLLAVLAALAISTPSAKAASGAESYVQQEINSGLSILNDHSLGNTLRRDKFRQFILTLTDMKRIAMFTLGPYRRGAAQGDLDSFVTAFTDYANAVYEVHLAKYKSQTMRVTGSEQRTPTDVVVKTEVLDPSVQQPITAAFRVLSENGHFVVIDVEVEGVWLAIDQRDQFTAFLQQHGGNIPALSEHLKKLTTQILAGGSPSQSHE